MICPHRAHSVDPEPLYHYVVLRRDLPPGVALAQTVHAAGESARMAPDLPPDTHAVVLQVAGEPELLLLAAELTAAGVRHVLEREPDPPYLGAAMAIGLPPQPRVNLRQHLRKLALYK